MRVVSSFSSVEAGVVDGHARGGDGELAEARHAPRLLAVHVVLRVEVAHLAVDLDGVVALLSNRVIQSMPERPSTQPCQNSSTLLPSGVRAPMPVMTTRRSVA